MPYDPVIVRRINRIGRRRNMDPDAILGNLATGIVESNLQNLPGGDADSYGYRQQREGIYGRDSLRKQINNFYDEWNQLAKPGLSIGENVANIQRPAAQYRGRYADVLDEARKLMGRGGGGVIPKTQMSGVGTPPVSSGGNLFETLRALNAPTANDSPMQQQLQKGWDMLAAMSQQEPQQTPPVVTGFQGGGGGPVSGEASQIRELFGPGGSWDEGKEISQIPGHEGHVHIAAENALLRKILAKGDKKFDIAIREFEPYDPVDPVHTKGSFHYNDEAADVSGPDMLAFQRWVRRKFSL